jgi:hypothetical protein
MNSQITLDTEETSAGQDSPNTTEGWNILHDRKNSKTMKPS